MFYSGLIDSDLFFRVSIYVIFVLNFDFNYWLINSVYVQIEKLLVRVKNKLAKNFSTLEKAFQFFRVSIVLFRAKVDTIF